MLISKTYEKINHCLELSESMNLSNQEEETITLELVRNFNRLLKQILTKNEIVTFKTKVRLIKQFKKLQKLKKKLITHETKIQWQPYLNMSSNIRLLLSPHNESTWVSIYQDLLKKIDPPSKKSRDQDRFYTIEHPECTSMEKRITFLNTLSQSIKTEGLAHIIIPSKCILNDGAASVMDSIELIANQLMDGSLIIEVSQDTHFNDALSIVQHISSMNDTIHFGLSLPLNHKKTIKHTDQIFESLNQNQLKRFILRIKKGAHQINGKTSYTYEQQIKMNTYYKWSVYTIMNYVRKNNCHCMINSNNLYDISWGLTMRAQMDIEKNIKFETNITKFPNIAKLLYMINQASIHTESLLLTNNPKEKLNIMLEKLIHQGQIYNGYKNIQINQKVVFKKSHRRFFNYLRRNYLDKYLSKFQKVHQNTFED